MTDLETENHKFFETMPDKGLSRTPVFLIFNKSAPLPDKGIQFDARTQDPTHPLGFKDIKLIFPPLRAEKFRKGKIAGILLDRQAETNTDVFMHLMVYGSMTDDKVIAAAWTNMDEMGRPALPYYEGIPINNPCNKDHKDIVNA